MTHQEMLEHYLQAYKPVRTPDDPLVDANDIAMPEDEIAFWKTQPRDDHGRWLPGNGQEGDEGPG